MLAGEPVFQQPDQPGKYSMTNPKSLIFQLHKHWDVVEALVRAVREYPAFRSDQVLALVGRMQPGLEFPAREDVVHSLLRADNDRIRQAAARLADLIRQVRLQLDADKQAIMQIAEEAKSADSQIPLKRRYRRVLEAYDQYIEPMNQLMDTGPQGVFRHHLEAAEVTLDRVLDWYTAQGALYSHRLQIRQVAYQAKALRREGRLIAQQCADTLFPLRDHRHLRHSPRHSAEKDSEKGAILRAFNFARLV